MLGAVIDSVTFVPKGGQMTLKLEALASALREVIDAKAAAAADKAAKDKEPEPSTSPGHLFVSKTLKISPQELQTWIKKAKEEQEKKA